VNPSSHKIQDDLYTTQSWSTDHNLQVKCHTLTLSVTSLLSEQKSI